MERRSPLGRRRLSRRDDMVSLESPSGELSLVSRADARHDSLESHNIVRKSVCSALLSPGIGPRQWTGTALAVSGVLIVSYDSLSFGTAPLWAYGATVGSMLAFAFASVVYRSRRRVSMPVHQSLCIHTLTAAFLFFICAWFQGNLMPPLTREFAIGMVWLVLVATFAAYAVYYTCLRLYPVAKVSAAIYLSPPVTMLWAWALFSEPLTAPMFLGLAVTMAGVWMTSRA